MFKTSFMRQNVKNVVIVDTCVCKQYQQPQNFVHSSAFSLLSRCDYEFENEYVCDLSWSRNLWSTDL